MGDCTPSKGATDAETQRQLQKMEMFHGGREWESGISAGALMFALTRNLVIQYHTEEDLRP